MMRKTRTQKKPQSIDFEGYTDLLADVLDHVKAARVKATMAINSTMIRLYWEIGSKIVAKQRAANWGDQVLQILSQDIRSSFPGVKGYSVTNLKYMRMLASTYDEEELRVVSQIPWSHNQILLNRLNDNPQRLWYAQKSTEHGWSGAILQVQLENDLFSRQGKALTNFQQTLPPIQSDLAQQAFKDPYIFDFISLRDEYIERELEDGLIDHVQKTLLEFGAGWAFVGRQYHLQVGDEDYYPDLLFYHLKLRRYVVVELKTTKFTPSDAGQLNFYLTAVDELLRHEDDQPTIGLLLCDGKHDLTVEWALRDLTKPIGVSGYKVDITEYLPDNLEETLPSREEIAARISRKMGKSLDHPMLDPPEHTNEQVNSD